MPPGCLLPAQPQQYAQGCSPPPAVCPGVPSPRSTTACRRPRDVKDGVCVRVCVRMCVWPQAPGPRRVPLPGSMGGGPQPQDSLPAGEGARPSFPRTQSRRRSPGCAELVGAGSRGQEGRGSRLGVFIPHPRLSHPRWSRAPCGHRGPGGIGEGPPGPQASGEDFCAEQQVKDRVASKPFPTLNLRV